MSEDIMESGGILLKKLERLGKFGHTYGLYPYQEAARIAIQLKELALAIPEIGTPVNHEQLLLAELKRRLNGEAFSLEQRITPRYYDFDTMISLYAIPLVDITDLKDWLAANRDRTLDAIERLYQTKDVQNYQLEPRGDIPSVRRQGEEFAAVHIQKYHKRLGKLLQEQTKVAEFLRDISAVPTLDRRSYFDSLTCTLAIGIPAICFTNEDGSLQINERELIRIYGHEGMGHALNQVITNNNSLPYFLTRDSGMTMATMESIAQFYQRVIFEDLKNSPESQRELGVLHKFSDIYQEMQDLDELQEYQKKLFYFAITVLADKSLGNPQEPETVLKKVDLLNTVTLNPSYPLHFVEQHRNNFDSQGNLNPELVGELRYCANPVQRALKEFAAHGIQYAGEGRSKIDATLLKGFWTPIGYVDNARSRAQEK